MFRSILFHFTIIIHQIINRLFNNFPYCKPFFLCNFIQLFTKYIVYKSYELDFGNGLILKNNTGVFSNIFEKPFSGKIVLKITDNEGKCSILEDFLFVLNATKKISEIIIKNREIRIRLRKTKLLSALINLQEQKQI